MVPKLYLTSYKIKLFFFLNNVGYNKDWLSSQNDENQIFLSLDLIITHNNSKYLDQIYKCIKENLPLYTAQRFQRNFLNATSKQTYWTVRQD